ncbi:hypothetical protein PLICRDRAFT_114769 [Plicaturopsis crispa FD-325 SS-3]|nr:hypothetical protein PLICRDRAFT_114769 [Plicaturopsis crispa FD-325 SS-3]
MVLLRFAPSPTGPLHLGGLRTALYNHLYARKLGGKWILRIEDTDATRLVPGSVDGIRRALEWAKLDYDYGPGMKGPHEPYYQSERLDLYHSYTRKLLEAGHAYRCFCSPDTLNAKRETLARSGSNKTYDKTCLHLTEEDVARRVRAGQKSVVRLNDSNVPHRESVSDLIFGVLKDNHASLPTDPILLKTDLFPTYHLASVVDDHNMDITHVLRGEEWLPSLPLHLDLYACLGLPPPQYAHIPILVNSDGTKMSKRNGDVQVVDYINRGWEPDAVVNWLALAGWGVNHESSPPRDTPSNGSRAPEHAPDSTTLMTRAELIENFDIAKLTHRRNVLDIAKLEVLNKGHLKLAASSEEGLQRLALAVHEPLKEAYPRSQYTSIEHLMQILPVLVEGRVLALKDVVSQFPWVFWEPDYTTPAATEMRSSIPDAVYNEVLQNVHARLASEETWNGLPFDVLLKEATGGTSRKVFYKAVRHALTGTTSGPSLPEVLAILGRERSLQRLAPAPEGV